MNYLTVGLFLNFFFIAECLATQQNIFDPAMFGGKYKNLNIDLLNNGGQLPGTYNVDILLNGKQVDSREILFIDDDNELNNNRLQPCISSDLLSRYGVKIKDYPRLSKGNESKDKCADLSAIPNASTKFQYANQQLLITIPHSALFPKAKGIAPFELWDDGVSAVLMNYTANTSRIEHSQNKKFNNGSQFIQLKPGINIGPWRIRNATTWHQDSGRSGNWQTLYTYAERGLNSFKSRITLGEKNTPSNIFDTVSFKGAMLGSDDAMVPYSYRQFAPIVRGIARTQARVEVKQNGYTIYSSTVAPGPFELSDVSPSSSGGNLEVTVWETDGNPQIFTVVFQTPAIALREGYLQYNIMVGQYRSALTSVEESVVSQATMVYGLPWNLTAYGGAQAAEHYRSAALGLGVALGAWGALSADGTHIWKQSKGDQNESGSALRLRYSKVSNVTNTSLSLSNSYYTPSGSATLSEVLDSYRGNETLSYNNINRRKTESSVILSQSFKDWGSLSLNGSRKDYWNKEGHSDSFGVTYGVSVGSATLSLNWLGSKRTFNKDQKQNDNITNFMVSMPFGGVVRANYQMLSPSSSGKNHNIGLSGQAFNKQLDWRVNQKYSPDAMNGDKSSSAMNLRWHGSYADVMSSYSYGDNVRQMSAGVTGGIVMHNNGITFGQPFSDTIALIEAPGTAGVSVNGWPGVKTDFRGYTTQSYLRPYQENKISVDPSTLSDFSDIPKTDIRVVPTKGAVIPAVFATSNGARALIKLTHADGSNIAFGSLVKLAGTKGNAFKGVVDENGVVFLTGLSAEGELQVNWGQSQQQQCRVIYRLPKNAGQSNIYEMSGICN